MEKIKIVNIGFSAKLAIIWRPVSMFFFLILVAAYWFGLVAVPVEIANRMFDLLQLAFSGYVIGRSVEKVADSVTKNINFNDIRKNKI